MNLNPQSVVIVSLGGRDAQEKMYSKFSHSCMNAKIKKI
jgi:hypothetical protein